MIKMKRVLAIISALLMAISAGCSGNSSKVLSTALSQIDVNAGEYKDRHSTYDSPYTLGYKNQDGTLSLYIFSAPVQYKHGDGYEIIDNTVVQSKRSEFAFENKANDIKTYFPARADGEFRIERGDETYTFTPHLDSTFSDGKIQTVTNLYGDRVTAVIYGGKTADLTFYPVKSGVKIEVKLRQDFKNPLRYSINAPKGNWINNDNGYLLLKGESNKNIALVYEPLVQRDGGIDPGLVDMSIDENDILTIAPRTGTTMKKGITFDFSFELYQNKVPDTSVYSEMPHNSFLRHYALVGQNTAFGEGWEYQRFRINYLVQTDATNILDAQIHLRELNPSGGESAIRLNRMKEDWSSAQDVWNSRKQNMSQAKPQPITLGAWNSFDVTKLVKECIMDMSWESETFGLCYQGGDGGPSLLLATSDNALYTPYLVIRFKSEPEYFVVHDNINPPMN